jgi:site-specific DNA-methyltransferase (cytosine-N4-specific)
LTSAKTSTLVVADGETIKMELNIIVQGDCLEVLKTFPDESINCCVTSPPYWALRDYGTSTWKGGNPDCEHKGDVVLGNNRNFIDEGGRGSNKASIGSGNCVKCGAVRVDKQLGLEPTFKEYINNLCNIFDEVKRVLRKDGTCFVNLGDTYAGGGGNSSKYSCGPNGIDKRTYARPEIARTNRFSKWQSDTPDSIQRCHEFEKDFDNVQDKSLCQIPSRFAIEMTDRGWILRNRLIWHKPNCMPSSVKDRFTVDYEDVFFFVKSKKYWFEQQFDDLISSLHVPGNNFHPDKIAGVNDRGGHSQWEDTKTRIWGDERGKNKRSVWNIPTQGFSEAHFATYPEQLIYPMIKAGCPSDGIVLDPFMGAGTSAIVALKQDKNYVGIELNPEYIEIAEKRIKKYTQQIKLRME